MAEKPDQDTRNTGPNSPSQQSKPAAQVKDPLAAYRSAGDPQRIWRIADTVLAIATALMVLSGVWLVPHINSDLFTMLAGGRDVMNGKLATPDEWSFATVDPGATKHNVWINQTWLSGAAMYLTQKSLGYNGLLVLKAVLLAAIGLILLKIMRARGTPWKTALLTLAFVLVCSQDYYGLGGGIWTLLLAPLLLWALFSTQKTPRIAWLAAGIIWIWANMQGSFILGLGMMTLWTLCLLTWEAISGGPVAAFRKYWPLAAATVLATGLAALANPFGLANLTQSLAWLTDTRWHVTSEWNSIFETFFGITWLFWLGLIVVIGLGLIRLLSELVIRGGTGKASGDVIALAVFELLALTAVAILAQRAPDNPQMFYVRWGSMALALLSLLPLAFAIKDAVGNPVTVDARRLGMRVFEALLATAGIAMALSAVQFVPLAMIFLTPLAAGQIAWAMGRARNFAFAVSCVLILSLGWMAMGAGIRVYSSDNQIQPQATMFEHMHGIQVQRLPSLAAFLNDNRIDGRALTTWDQEGQLRWFCPQVKVYFGARGQAVYSARTLQNYLDINNSRKSLPQFLADRDVHVAIFPSPSAQSPQWKMLMQIAEFEANPWDVVYCDGVNLVMADKATKSTRRLVNQLKGGVLQGANVGDLKYSDPAIAGLSKGYSIALRSPQEGLMPLAHSLAHRPTEPACRYFCRAVLSAYGSLSESDRDKMIVLLERQASRLEKQGVPPHTGMEILQCREIIYNTLKALYTRAKTEKQGPAAHELDKKAAAAADNARLMEKKIKEVILKWGIAYKS